MSQIYKRELVFVVTGIVALIMIAEYYFAIPGIGGKDGIANQVKTWALIIQLMAIGLGAINLMQVHVRNIQRKNELMPYSASSSSLSLQALDFGSFGPVLSLLLILGYSPMYIPRSAQLYML
jgi:hypothetical protein